MPLKSIFLSLFVLTYCTTLGQQQLQLEKLDTEINSTKYDEINPIVSHDGQTVYFTRVGHPDFDKTLEVEGKNLFLNLSTRQYDTYLSNIYSRIAGYKIRNATLSSYNQDVWIARFVKGEFLSLTHPGPPLNNALPNSICALTPAKNSFVLLNQFLLGGGMEQGFSIIEKKENQWQFPKPIEIENYYTTGSNVNLTMSLDGEVLIMSLKRNDSFGKNDLYVSFKNGVGGWTEPMNLGSIINSRASEDTPAISEDKKTMYFSSNRSNTMGGRDIFRSKRNSENWTDWTVPRRFIAPINSDKDDSQPYFNDVTGYLYFTSNREGSADIYRVSVASSKPDIVLVRGKVVNSVTNELLPGKVLYGSTELGYYAKYFKSKDGKFEFRIPKGKDFKLTAQKRDFLSPTKIIETKKGKYYPVQEVTLTLTPIKNNVEIDLDPIYFKQSESTILEDSYPALHQLLTLLKKNPNISIRIEGHTENRGKPKDLKDLSEKRAYAIKRFLQNGGIDGERVSTIGYGATRPAKPNKNETLRQRNRRVEIRIIK